MKHVLLSLIAAILISSVHVLAANAATITTYDWTSLSGFTPITQSCSTISNNTLTMTCQSGALLSIQKWNPAYNLTLEGTASGQPAPGSTTTRYWAGLVLLQEDDGPNAHYAQLATVNNVNPISGRRVASLTLPSQPGGKSLLNGESGRSYSFKIAYNANDNKVRYYVNGSLKQTRGMDFTGPIHAETICVSVHAGQGNDGSSARCIFGPMKITGEKLSG